MPSDKQQKALEALKKDFGEEGLELLLSGADSILDLTKQFNMPYDKVVEKMKSDDEQGLVRQVGDQIIGIQPKPKENEEESSS